jgi:Ser/Thr protein kinase RdoA (MazF antagonist)
VRGITANGFAIVTEGAKGETLLSTQVGLADDALRRALRVALLELRRCGVVHNDFTPGNVVYDIVSDRVTILDFESSEVYTKGENTVDISYELSFLGLKI